MTDTRQYDAPGPGSWELDQTHMSRPLTSFAFARFQPGFVRGFKEGMARYGLTLTHLQPEQVHGFVYMRPMPVGAPPNAAGPPPKFILQVLSRVHPEMRKRGRACREAFADKLWLQDLKLWDDDIKPDSIKRNGDIQAIDPDTLSEGDLKAHIARVADNLEEMVYRHHKFSVSSILPVGRYVALATEATGLTAGEVLGLLRGSTPVSRGTAAKEMEALCEELRKAGVTSAALAGTSLDALSARSPEIKAALQRYLDVVGYVVTSGYCVGEQFALEQPDMLLKTIAGALDSTATAPDEAAVNTREQEIRAQVPPDQRASFDDALTDARKINRIRDERGVYNDLWAAGLARRAILSAGRRLQTSGKLSEPEHLIEATHSEIDALLDGKGGPTDEELKTRRQWRTTMTVADAPPWLGEAPSPPPPHEWFPASLRAGQQAISAALSNVFDPPDAAETDAIAGNAVSPGVYEGTARVIRGSEDFPRLERGDVLVTKNTSAAFNVVLPLLGAIVTDRGGVLSHAAIVAREYGIPGVVSTRNATRNIPDGARVRVDGNAGTVQVL